MNTKDNTGERECAISYLFNEIVDEQFLNGKNQMPVGVVYDFIKDFINENAGSIVEGENGEKSLPYGKKELLSYFESACDILRDEFPD